MKKGDRSIPSYLKPTAASKAKQLPLVKREQSPREKEAEKEKKVTKKQQPLEKKEEKETEMKKVNVIKKEEPALTKEESKVTTAPVRVDCYADL